MTVLSRLRVGARLAVSFGLLVLVITATAAAGWWGMRTQQAVQVDTDELASARAAVQQFQYTVADIAGWQGLVVADAGIIGGAAATKPSAMNRAGYLEAEDQLVGALKALETAGLSGSEGALAEPLRETWDRFFTEDERIVALLRTERTDARAEALASINDGESAAAYDSSIVICEKLQESIAARSKALRDRAAQTSTLGNVVLGCTLAAAVLLAVVAGSTVTRSVVRPLRQVIATLGRLADGDLTARARLDRRDELGTLGAAVDRSSEALQRALGHVRAGAEVVSSVASNLLASANRMADSAETSRAQANEVSAASDSVLANLRTLVDGSREVSLAFGRIAENANEAAQVAGEAVGTATQTGQTITALGESSAEITNIVSLINGIAGQTNLLALNATIEAARAGEQGRGFAVVADEVKDLAHETEKATGDITERVQTIQDDTGRAVAAIDAITEVIGRINRFQERIAAAIDEQMTTTRTMDDSIVQAAGGSEQIAGTIGRLSESTEVTAHDVDQARGAAVELADASDSLRAAVAQFTV